MSHLDDITTAIETAREWLGGVTPELALVLGSGLSGILEQLEQGISLSYADLPGFTASGVAGHPGCLHAGRLFGRSVLVFQGRYHYYEGYSAWQVTAPVRLAAALGCPRVLLTNAAGGISPRMQAGDFMLVSDHISMVADNPLRGRPELEFVDLCGLYRSDFYPQLSTKLQGLKSTLHIGVLAWMAGPSYETPAEIRMLEHMGASAVSMSTIPEAIVARRLGLEVVALSYISNLAAGKTAASLDHQDVLASGQRSLPSLETLLHQLFALLFD